MRQNVKIRIVKGSNYATLEVKEMLTTIIQKISWSGTINEKGVPMRRVTRVMCENKIVISVSSFVTIQKHPDTADSNQLKPLILYFKVDEWYLQQKENKKSWVPFNEGYIKINHQLSWTTQKLPSEGRTCCPPVKQTNVVVRGLNLKRTASLWACEEKQSDRRHMSILFRCTWTDSGLHSA